LNCPICEGKVWSTVEDTRAKEGFTLRRRECGNGHKFVTEERLTAQVMIKKPQAVKQKGESQLDQLLAPDGEGMG
jgi:transcriptional regulator NrdR family protein